MRSVVQTGLLLLATLLPLQALLLSEGPCSTEKPCKRGCCSKQGHCGFGPDFCDPENCASTCDAHAECGEFALEGHERCPLNVCCSQWGFCGTSQAFCDKEECQNGCEEIKRPSCSGNSASQRYAGYYESWHYKHPCDVIHPSDINAEPWTHLNYAFALINKEDHSLETVNSYDEEFYRAFIDLKIGKPSLKCYLSVGGWDAGGKVFSAMANSTETRKAFIQSAIEIMDKYRFDGIDIDWEYPVADDRGGSDVDYKNYVKLLKELKDACGEKYGVTIAIPASYWYLQGFNVKEMTKYVDWFNIMSYDIHGVWDGHNQWTQQVINPHTNMTEISSGLDLLWRNHVPPDKVSLGLAFYGRSFTLDDPECTTPGCPFKRTGGKASGGAAAGQCTANSGTLSNYEIEKVLKMETPDIVHDGEAGVNWITWDQDQWVSFDDAKTLKQKVDFANEMCLGGTFAWAIDLGGPGTLNHPDQLNANMSLAGADPEGEDSGSGDVYISPEIFDNPDPAVSCVPPCTFILPPFSLESPTTITFPPYTTSLEVVWSTTTVITITNGAVSTSRGLSKTIQNTTLSIPPVTTSLIDVWHWPVTKDPKNATLSIMSSVHPPPFIITETLPPQASIPPQASGSNEPQGTTQITGSSQAPGGSDSEFPSPTTTESNQTSGQSDSDSPPFPTTEDDEPGPRGITRTIAPPPYPYSTETDSGDTILPIVSYKKGPPGPRCTSGCGRKCKKHYCDGPCEHDCGDGEDFISPEDDDPPKNKKKCRGIHCKNGKCTGPLCIPIGCTGEDCLDGICLGPNCAPTICGGNKKKCPGNQCLGDCSDSGNCLSFECLTFGCTGPDCGPDMKCKGPRCTPVTCTGVNCREGMCQGPDCEPGEEDGCSEAQSAPRCTESVTEWKAEYTGTEYTTTTHTKCLTVTACSAEPTTVTTTTTTEGDADIETMLACKAAPSHSDKKYKELAQKIELRQSSWVSEEFGKSTSTKTTTTAKPGPTYSVGEERRNCFNSGHKAERGDLIDAIKDFCGTKGVLDATKPRTTKQDRKGSYKGRCMNFFREHCFSEIHFELQVKENCRIELDGRSDPDSLCGYSTRVIVDQCNTEGENGKQGGTLETDCAFWSIDPNLKFAT